MAQLVVLSDEAEHWTMLWSFCCEEDVHTTTFSEAPASCSISLYVLGGYGRPRMQIRPRTTTGIRVGVIMCVIEEGSTEVATIITAGGRAANQVFRRKQMTINPAPPARIQLIDQGVLDSRRGIMHAAPNGFSVIQPKSAAFTVASILSHGQKRGELKATYATDNLH